MSCKCCLEDWICKCIPYGSVITVNSYLMPATEYKWVLTDKFGNKYSETFETDEVGHFEINLADLPEGFFSEFNGGFKIEVQDGEKCKPIKFIMALEVDCIEVSTVGGTMNKDTIGCDILTLGGSGGGGGGV